MEEQIKIYMSDEKDKGYDQEKIIGLNKRICDGVKLKLKNEFSKRYKFVVHCVIGNSI